MTTSEPIASLTITRHPDLIEPVQIESAGGHPGSCQDSFGGLEVFPDLGDSFDFQPSRLIHHCNMRMFGQSVRQRPLAVLVVELFGRIHFLVGLG